MAAQVSTSVKSKYHNEIVATDPAEREKAERFYKDCLDSNDTLWDFGRPMPEEYFPKQVQLIKGKEVFDYDGAHFTMVSDRLKRAIEDIEPGVHQFVPVDVLGRDGAPYGGQYWFFTLCSFLDAISPDLGGVYKREGYDFANHPDRYSWVIKSGGRNNLAVYKDKIAGHAVWYDVRYPSSPFYADALLNRLEAEGMEGWEKMTYWAEI
ncbi:imm11 family protein [Paremcibacter congregatus]|uniref:imm11 family protein n=1 Tax=Paremcibacter congregatus TaxID=2043170 RepID=UPI0030EC9779